MAKTYLDNNATAPIRPEVIEIMAQSMAHTGNASSIHGFGRESRRDVEKARKYVADLAGTSPNQVIFTSGATESNNMIVKHYADQKTLISAVEHPAVRDANKNATMIPVTRDGAVNLEAYKEMLSSDTGLVSVMLVNNETGVIQPVQEIARMAKDAGATVHSDAVQAAGRIPIDFAGLGVDYLSLSAHKFGGPQGVGALIFRSGLEPPPLLHGGGQERRARAGTENVAGIIGFGEAARIAQKELGSFQELSNLREKLEREVKKISPDVIIYGENAPRVANTTCLGLPGVPAETLLMHLDLAGIAVSSGSACSSGVVKTSPVIRAMGASEKEAASTIRISMSWQTRAGDIDHFLKIWSKIITRLDEKTTHEKESSV